jgi:hypothetical protein
MFPFSTLNFFGIKKRPIKTYKLSFGMNFPADVTNKDFTTQFIRTYPKIHKILRKSDVIVENNNKWAKKFFVSKIRPLEFEYC